MAFDLALLDPSGYLYTTVTGSSSDPLVRRSFLYFDVYLREIEFMIEHKLKAIYFGPGLLEVKQQFGCSLYEQSMIIRSPFLSSIRPRRNRLIAAS